MFCSCAHSRRVGSGCVALLFIPSFEPSSCHPRHHGNLLSCVHTTAIHPSSCPSSAGNKSSHVATAQTWPAAPLPSNAERTGKSAYMYAHFTKGHYFPLAFNNVTNVSK